MSINRIKQIIWVSNILLLAFIFYVVSKIFTPDDLYSSPLPTSPKDGGKKTELKKTTHWYESIWTTPVGQISNKPIATNTGQSKAGIIRSLIKVETIVSEESALLVVSGKKNYTRVDSVINVNNMSVKFKNIIFNENKAVFEFGGEEIVIKQEEDKSPTRELNILKSDTREKKGEVDRIGPNSLLIENSDRDRIVNNIDKYIKEIEPTIQTDGNRTLGVRLGNVPGDSEAARYGFSKGDIITGVNGIKITSMGQIPDLVRRNKNLSKIEITIIRNGQPLHFTFNIR